MFTVFTAAAAVVIVGLLVAGPPIKTYVVVLLGAYRKFQILLLRLRGLTPETEADNRVVTGQAWNEFCDALKAAGASMVAPGCPTDPFTQAEGYRYLSRLTRVALENFLENSDPRAPKLAALANGIRTAPVKIGSDNPDNLYENAQLNAAYVYRVFGTAGTVNYLGFGVQAGSYGKPGGLQTVDYKEREEMDLVTTDDGKDRRIEFFISTEAKRPAWLPKGSPNWLCMVEEPSSHNFIVRQTFGNRFGPNAETPAKLTIELVGEDTIPSNLTTTFLDDALGTCALFVGGASMMFTVWAKDFQKHTNQLPLFDQEKSNKAGGDPNIRYYHSYWKLEKDECLVIEATPPECQTWNFQLNNHWMESLDYRYHTIHVNKSTAVYRENPDGIYRDSKDVCVVVAHSDPQLPDVNWISTVGHGCGTMCWRWIKLGPSEADPPAPPRPRVVKFADWVRSESKTSPRRSPSKAPRKSSSPSPLKLDEQKSRLMRNMR